MPGESLAAYINNTTTLIVFVAFTVILFFMVYLISYLLSKKSGMRNIIEKKQFTDFKDNDVLTCINYRKDPNLGKNLIILGSMLIFSSFFMILTLACLNYRERLLEDAGIFIVFSIIFLVIMATIYLVKSDLLE